MSQPIAVPDSAPVWTADRRPWGRADAVALLVWTLVIAAFFWDAVSLRKAFFYFDITEINYPYRDFLARELRAGRFSRWHPGLYCGLPLFSESQAGYLHPLKYVLYPWLKTWQAFNLDTVLSVWLTGLGTYGWLRRRVGPAGALTGAGVFGLSGFVWAHLIHTSMINALTSVPLVVWALEAAWERARFGPMVLGALALACQVFAGHLQDTILTAGLIGLYGLYRAATERTRRARVSALGTAVGLVALGMMLAAVQWVPSKELLSRSPRSEGLSWEDLTYGSWHPELLPTLVVREAYGTRARDTDWMDGFYPYHEMNAYLGVIALGLAVVGAAACRDRWVAFWVGIAGLGGLMMLGKFTCVFDVMPWVPVVGSSRVPVRYHLWVALATAALAAVGVDRLARPGRVSLRGAFGVIGVLAALSVPILLYVYEPVWMDTGRWTLPYHVDRYRWLGRELAWGAARTAALALLAGLAASTAARTLDLRRRAALAAVMPALVIADLLGAHWRDAPTIDPAYWTAPPPTVAAIRADPVVGRVYGAAKFSAGEPGYASEPVDFFAVRDALDWSLAPVWGLPSSAGETPLISRRLLEFTDHVSVGRGRFEVQGVTHFLSGHPAPEGASRGEAAGRAFIHRVPLAWPRARLSGRPLYVATERDAVAALERLGPALRDRVVIEDPDRPLPVGTVVSGSATITRDDPEHVAVATDSPGPAYLFLADTFDPGWSARLDGRPAPIRPADVAFRAVYLPAGRHSVVFTYEPAGFRLGLGVTGVGLVLALLLAVGPWRLPHLAPEHGARDWPRRWPVAGFALLAAIVVVSAVRFDASGRPALQRRWSQSVHRFTWGAGFEAMRQLRGRSAPLGP